MLLSFPDFRNSDSTWFTMVHKYGGANLVPVALSEICCITSWLNCCILRDTRIHYIYIYIYIYKYKIKNIRNTFINKKKTIKIKKKKIKLNKFSLWYKQSQYFQK